MTQTEKGARPPVILVATDQEWAARSLDSILAPNGYAVIRAYSGRQAIEFARSTQPDAVILDAKPPDVSGADVCRMLRDDPRIGPTIPVIITATESGNRVLRNEAFAAGAWQFCSQPLDGEALLMQLRTFVGAKRAADHLREDSFIDELTGLYSLRGLARRAREIGAEAQRRRMALACVAFGPAADAPGVSESDPALARHIGAICKRASRISDAVGRLGQTEFAVVAPATDQVGARRLLERLREAVEETPTFTEGVPRRLRIRAGYDAVDDFARSPVDAEEMLLRATSALRYARSADVAPGGGFTSFDQVPTTQSR